MRTLVPAVWAAAALALLAASGPPAHAGVTLRAGDVVMVDSYVYPSPVPAVWRLDPVTLDTTLIASGGLLVHPDRVAVDGSGRVVVADRVSGVVAIDPATGAQTLVASPAGLGGRTARGICRDPNGGLYLTVALNGSGALFHLDPATHEVRVVADGGLLVAPVCVTVGPGGALFVGDMSLVTPVSSGGIVKVTPTGEQSLVATTGAALAAPFDIAITPDGWIWTAQWGALSRRGASFMRTRLTDGYTEAMSYSRAQGITIDAGGNIYLADCSSVSFDCFRRFVWMWPGGLTINLPSGAMAVVPASQTAARRTTWGALKTLYR